MLLSSSMRYMQYNQFYLFIYVDSNSRTFPEKVLTMSFINLQKE